MPSSARNDLERDLLDLTDQPAAPACEQAVIAWVERWVNRRRGVKLRRDRFGNMLIQRAAGSPGTDQTSNAGRGHRGRPPLLITAHMDHPAFVVTERRNDREVVADFRGSVAERFFEGSPVRLWQYGKAVQTGVVQTLHHSTQRDHDQAVIRLNGKARPEPGDIITWRLPASRIQGDRLRAPVCDDLVGVAAALHAFDRWRAGKAGRNPHKAPDVRVLLTRCEEIGFIGAMAACRGGLIPKRARLVLLENSKSFADSPIAGGPIVRVGDRTSTFDPDLTYQITQVAGQLAKRDTSFRYQRRLMPGGTCEATAYHSLGYAATCLCLPLGNYHNMNERTGRIDRETISLSDYHALVRLLVEIGKHLDDPKQTPALREHLDRLYENRKHLLGG